MRLGYKQMAPTLGSLRDFDLIFVKQFRGLPVLPLRLLGSILLPLPA